MMIVPTSLNGLNKEELMNASPCELNEEQRKTRIVLRRAQEQQERALIMANGIYNHDAAVAHTQKWGLVTGGAKSN